MKIGEIKVGAEYGAYDNPARTWSLMPRHVRALEIVTEPERRIPAAAFAEAKTVNVRKVRVEFLDETQNEHSRTFSRTPIEDAPQGSTLVVEARQLAAPWKKVRSEVGREIDRRARERAFRAKVEARLRGIGVDPDEVHIEVYVIWNAGQRKREWFELRLREREAKKVLGLAEDGKAKS